jgi:hypothetical protein
VIDVDLSPMRDAVREHYAQVVDDGFQALMVDMNENGPRSDVAHDHMIDLVELTASEDGDTLISRTIHSPADYSSFVDSGTEPHRIDGNPLLAFTAADGTRVIVRYVNHPGTARTGWWSDRTANLLDYLSSAMR